MQSLIDEIVSGIEPPSPQLVKRIVAAFGRRQKRGETVANHQAELAFDSLTAGAGAGQRGGTVDERQLLFSTETADLDLQIVDTDETHHLHGQLLFTEDSTDLFGIELRLEQSEENLHRIGLTDQLGRFTFTNVADGNYTLHVLCDDHNIVLEQLLVA